MLQDTPHSVNHAGFIIHSCIHEARHDVGCIIHTHTRAGVAVSAQKNGILPISQQSTYVLSSLAYHDYEGVAVREDEQPRLQQDLGEANFLVLRNHGLLTVEKNGGRRVLVNVCTGNHLPNPISRAVWWQWAHWYWIQDCQLDNRSGENIGRKWFYRMASVTSQTGPNRPTLQRLDNTLIKRFIISMISAFSFAPKYARHHQKSFCLLSSLTFSLLLICKNHFHKRRIIIFNEIDKINTIKHQAKNESSARLNYYVYLLIR